MRIARTTQAARPNVVVVCLMAFSVAASSSPLPSNGPSHKVHMRIEGTMQGDTSRMYGYNRLVFVGTAAQLDVWDQPIEQPIRGRG